jgi:hypothetical protein
LNIAIALPQLELHPAVVDCQRRELQVSELVGQSLGPTERFIEQFWAEQLLKFVSEECSESHGFNASLLFAAKFDIDIAITDQLDGSISNIDPVRSLNRGGFVETLFFLPQFQGSDAETDSRIIEMEFHRLESIQRNGPWAIFFFARNTLGSVTELGDVAIHIFAAEDPACQNRVEEIAEGRLMDLYGYS